MQARKISVATAVLRTEKQVKNEQDVTVLFDIASPKPDWEIENKVEVRALWQVVALALNVNPVSSCVVARKKLDSTWKADYNKTVTSMCELLLPVRKAGCIFFDAAKPINSSRVGDREKLKFIRVDVSTATACLVQFLGLTKLPLGFQKMHEHLVNTAKPQSMLSNSTAGKDDHPHRAPKSQEKANETKTSNALKILLYAVIESQHGWAEVTDIDKNTIVVRIEKSLELHDFKSRRSLSLDWIGDAIVQGSELAPLRPKTDKTA